MKRNIYEIEKNVEKVLRGGSTGFLTHHIQVEVQNRLKKGTYQIFWPFRDAEKVILYSNELPYVKLFQICCCKGIELKHSAIMGSLFGLNITGEMFGDIVKWEGNFYVYLLGNISDMVVNELRMIGQDAVLLKEVPLEFLSQFEREYEKHKLIVSSLRVDTVLSRLILCNRDGILDKIRNQEIFVNDVVVKKGSSLLKFGDVFSIRRYGKFCFRSVIGKTKKDNYIIEIDKYI